MEIMVAHKRSRLELESVALCRRRRTQFTSIIAPPRDDFLVWREREREREREGEREERER